MKRCKSKKPSNDMPIDMVEAVLQRLFTMGHGPSHYEGREEAETEEEGDISFSVVIGEGDVVDAAGRMNTKKAAGVDGRLLDCWKQELEASWKQTAGRRPE